MRLNYYLKVSLVGCTAVQKVDGKSTGHVEGLAGSRLLLELDTP